MKNWLPLATILAFASPAAAQMTHSAINPTTVQVNNQPQAICQASAWYPGNRVGIEITITYPDGHSAYTWQYTNDYISVSLPFDLNEFDTHNQTEAHCATDFWGMPGDNGGGWYYDFDFTGIPIGNSSSAVSWHFRNETNTSDGCSNTLPTHERNYQWTCTATPPNPTFCPGGGCGAGAFMIDAAFTAPIFEGHTCGYTVYNPYDGGYYTGVDDIAVYYNTVKFLGIPIKREKIYGPSLWDGSCWGPQ